MEEKMLHHIHIAQSMSSSWNLGFINKPLYHNADPHQITLELEMNRTFDVYFIVFEIRNNIFLRIM